MRQASHWASTWCLKEMMLWLGNRPFRDFSAKEDGCQGVDRNLTALAESGAHPNGYGHGTLNCAEWLWLHCINNSSVGRLICMEVISWKL